MAVNIDENFLGELGLANATNEQKVEFIHKTAETLQMRVGMRLAEELSDEQLDEFETLTPEENDSAETVAKKQQHMSEWLQANYPHHEQVTLEEFEKLKAELKTSLNALADQTKA